MKLLLAKYRESIDGQSGPDVVTVSTPSYTGTHVDGFHAAVRALIECFATNKEERSNRLVVLSNMISAADLRYLREILSDWGVPWSILPDYSDSLDGGSWSDYCKLSEGGTSLDEIRAFGSAKGVIEFGHSLKHRMSGGEYLERAFGVLRHAIGIPIGIRETDRFFACLQNLTGTAMPEKYRKERARLTDAYVDGHKYIAGKNVAVYGDEDLVIGLSSWLAEIGMKPVVCATGAKSSSFRADLLKVAPELAESTILSGVDYVDIAEACERTKPEMLIGSSKGYRLSKALNVPLVRVGFPIHDRIGGQRILHIGYRGAQELFDRVVNTCLDRKQEASEIGYSYL